MPVGVAGELYVGGAGLARGYLGRPGPDRRAVRPGPVRRGRARGCTAPATWPAGARTATLEFLGRVDDQVKIRGFRVEPGEIEARARARTRASRDAVVAAREPSAGDQRLVAYVVGRRRRRPTDGRAARRTCAERLPEYMVPAGVRACSTRCR